MTDQDTRTPLVKALPFSWESSESVDFCMTHFKDVVMLVDYRGISKGDQFAFVQVCFEYMRMDFCREDGEIVKSTNFSCFF